MHKADEGDLRSCDRSVLFCGGRFILHVDLKANILDFCHYMSDMGSLPSMVFVLGNEPAPQHPAHSTQPALHSPNEKEGKYVTWKEKTD